MPTCKLPYKSSFDNSRVFLQDFEVIDDSFKILNDREFDSLINELEQNNIKAYNISGKPWLKDVSRGSEYAIPNLKVLDKIDQKRKDLNLYEDQLSAQISNQKILPPDEQVQYKFRVINALQSNNVREPKLDNLQGFYNDLIKQGTSSQQIDLVKDILSDVKGKVSKEDIIRELLVRYSYSVEVNTATQAIRNDIGSYDRFYLNGDYYAKVDTYRKNYEKISKEEYNKAIEEYKKIEQVDIVNTSYYSNLTVPGGTNYTENEIRTPGITPSITGHASFSSTEGIGWFRSDDKVNYNNFEEVVEIMKASGILKIEC